VIRRNRFEHAGGRAVNIGGSTGLKFFRPPLAASGQYAEARNLRVEGNTFIGSVVPVAFVGVDGALVRFNTIERLGRWALRILQETTAPGFVACRNGEFSDNTILFESMRWSEGGVNIGASTAPRELQVRTQLGGTARIVPNGAVRGFRRQKSGAFTANRSVTPRARQGRTRCQSSVSIALD